MRLPICLAVSLCLWTCVSTADDLAWPRIGREQKPWTRWWWPGSAVDKDNLTRQLTAYAEDGLGGVEVTPIYGARGYESRFIRFLSPRYDEMLGFAADEARRLDLGVDMATCTGWPFGGPWVMPADAEQKIGIVGGRLAPRPTRFKVKRSAPGGEGLVVDPFSSSAMERYLEPIGAALSRLPPGSIHAQFHDSYEYTGSWSDAVPAKFLAMHGYDLRNHLAELAGAGDPDTVARLKSDYRETLAELHLEYIQTWVRWSHRMGSIAREQAHGAPANLLDVYAAADVPETETFGSVPFPIPGYRFEPSEVCDSSPPPLVNRMASSAAHVAGKPLASSETFTWMREHFHGAPSEMKPELDQLFLTGINRIYWHGNAYSPADAPWPGWLFYASTQENTRNSLWREFGWLNAYIGRAQTLLQAGKPDNDVLVYWPVYDLWHDPSGWVKQFAMQNAGDWMDATPAGALARELVARGYQFDWISDAQLGRCLLSSGAVLTEGGGSYKAVLVPRTSHMPLKTLRKLLDLASAGATVIFADALPADVPGFAKLEGRRAEFWAELASLREAFGPGESVLSALPVTIPRNEGFAGGTLGVDGARNMAGGVLRSAALGSGKVILAEGSPDGVPLASSAALGAALEKSGAVPERAADEFGLGVLRRRVPRGEIYFIANLTGQPLSSWVPLGTAARGAVLMDARSGRAGVAALRRHGSGARVYLQLRPGESIFVKTFADRPAQGAAWAYAEEMAAPSALSGPWRVTFVEGGPVLPPAFAASSLGSWTDQGGDAVRFAGTARYETEFEIPEGAKPDDWMLDLGDVRETAKVFVNGTEVDRLWSLPFRTRIGACLKPGRNTLVLEVTNLSANRIRDLDLRKVPWKRFYEINFVNIHYRRLDASTWPVQPSGLLGPVRLIPLRVFLNP